MIAGHTVTDSLLEDFDKVKGSITELASSNFASLREAQANIGKEALDEIWPAIQQQIGGATDASTFDNWISVLEVQKIQMGAVCSCVR